QGSYVGGTSSYSETFDGKGGDDTELGFSCNDTFVFDQGYVRLTVEEYNPLAGTPNDVLRLGPGIDPSDVTVSGDQSLDVVLTIGSNGDQVTLATMLESANFAVQSVQFADGTIWTRDQI